MKQPFTPYPPEFHLVHIIAGEVLRVEEGQTWIRLTLDSPTLLDVPGNVPWEIDLNGNRGYATCDNAILVSPNTIDVMIDDVIDFGEADSKLLVTLPDDGSWNESTDELPNRFVDQTQPFIIPTPAEEP